MERTSRLFYVIGWSVATGGSMQMPGGETTGTEIFEYVIDADDVIVFVNESWKTFAEENGDAGLGDRVVGTWLWQHMSGLEVKHLFRVLLERVREGRRVVRVPFRCDAPDVRRHMMLEVTPLPDDAVRFVSWMEEEEGRPKVEILDASRTESEDHFLRMCAWCKRVEVSVGEPSYEWVSEGPKNWRELEDALMELDLLSQEPLPRITHGVCGDCKSRVMGELDRVF
jgi:hypothetical protein